jgi:hypothetical protein
MKKTHWKQSFDSPYIGSWDLEDYKDITLTIKSAKSQKTKGLKEDSVKNIIEFEENYKPMICNSGNSKTISKISGSIYLEDWAGTEITLFVKSVRAFGEDHDALRVRNETSKKPELTKEHKNFKAIKEGNFTIEQIKQKYTLSPATEKLLK